MKKSKLRKSRGTLKPREWALVSKDSNLGVIADNNPYWKQYGISGNFVRAVRLKKGLPAFSRFARGDAIRKRLLADPEITTASYIWLAEKYGVNRTFIGNVVRKSNIVREVPNFHPEYKRPWRTYLLESWMRPKGIDAHLEYLRDN